jgi:hypothetical protein
LPAPCPAMPALMLVVAQVSSMNTRRPVLKSVSNARMLEGGRLCTLAELAEAERISRSYIRRVLRLTLLVPDNVERILGGRPAAGSPGS